MRARALLVALVLVAVPVLAGCLGDDDKGDDGTSGGGDGTGTGGGASSGGAPVASFTSSPATGNADTTFTFDASPSKGDGLSYAWDIGAVAKKSGVKITHKFGFTDATIPIKLTVTDTKGQTATSAKTIRLGTGKNTGPVASVFATPNWVKPGDKVAFDASATTDPEGDAVTYTFGYAEAGGSVVVDSKDIVANGKWTHTYTETGTFRLHCHPHPNMKHNVTVLKGAKAPAGGKVDVAFQGFKFVPEELVVPPGTVVSYLNKDPVAHTVTLEKFEPELTPIPTTGATGSVTFPNAGAFKIVVRATDNKGASSTAEAPVLVDANRPDDVYENSWTGRINATVLGTPLDSPGRHSFKIDYPATGNLTLTYSTPVPSQEMTLLFQSGDKSFEASGPSPIALPVDIAAGTWTAVVSAERGAAIDYTLDVKLQLVLTPPAEGAEDHSAHQH
ncbi:MAG TPA: PKD domain-containing protein [Candidatus Thermoplasmatota archaeon]|nr:PKD domain-containing protein [Candidatus Thermoplasmatota archaeon]